MPQKKVEDRARELLEAARREGRPSVPSELQGVDKKKISRMLQEIDCNKPKLVGVVFALLDDQIESFFSKPPHNAKFCDGARTSHLATHVGMLQNTTTKLDREGRDQWIKPLLLSGVVERVCLIKRRFVIGHRTKNPNNAYRLTNEFKQLIAVSDLQLDEAITKWVEKSESRKFLHLQSQGTERMSRQGETPHSRLISACNEIYASNFLPGYAVLYVDDDDGDRITDDERQKLSDAGMELLLDDAMPDILLWNKDIDAVWVIEAVTTDGEVDFHKVAQVVSMVLRCGKNKVGFTTAYETWKYAAKMQGEFKNIYYNTYIWILEDASKHFFAASMKDAPFLYDAKSYSSEHPLNSGDVIIEKNRQDVLSITQKAFFEDVEAR